MCHNTQHEVKKKAYHLHIRNSIYTLLKYYIKSIIIVIDYDGIELVCYY